tara:strand:+ start:290 stop:496 length:207 start_codon:yes stop_codon:yes gene_type:complete
MVTKLMVISLKVCSSFCAYPRGALLLAQHGLQTFYELLGSPANVVVLMDVSVLLGPTIPVPPAAPLTV